jgi:predicted esterase
MYTDLLAQSNFSRSGPVRVGTLGSLGPFGTYDMAGNLKEWCSNAVDNRRYILGGGWTEPPYVFNDWDAQDPMMRNPTYGFRCAKFVTPPPPEVFAPRLRPPVPDLSMERPVDDAAFQLLRRFYGYDRAPLDVRQEGTDDTAQHWRQEKVSFTAAYGGERVPAYLLLPRNAKPPYQVVLYAPSASAAYQHNSRNLEPRYLDIVLRTGRALLFPVYKGTYERIVETTGPDSSRDVRIEATKDAMRSLDFLETRNDIDHARIAFLGVSRGSSNSIQLLAIEPRLRAAVLVAGGLLRNSAPELDPLSFARRVHIPLLMINGRSDFTYPYESAQLPLFQQLGTRPADKKLAMFDTGHDPPPALAAKEILDWLDHYLGPVERSGETINGK